MHIVRSTNICLFVAMWVWVMVTGMVLQWWILPATPWHAGHGLLAGGDWVTFQKQAMILADAIEQGGWSLWELRYKGQQPASLAAAAYALTGIREPWILLPIYGVLYGLAALALVAIAEELGIARSWRWRTHGRNCLLCLPSKDGPWVRECGRASRRITPCHRWLSSIGSCMRG